MMEWRDVWLAFSEVAISLALLAIFPRWAWTASIPRGGRVLMAGTIAAAISWATATTDHYHPPSPPIAYLLLACAWLLVIAVGVLVLLADRRSTTPSQG
jgi:hypothetical protein